MGGDYDYNKIQLFSKGNYFLPKLTTLLFVMFEVNRSLPGVSAQYLAYCSAYCDVYDNLISGYYCESLYHPVYCCGTVYNKTCCLDVLYKVEDTADETVCGHAWLYYQWSLIYGLVAVLLVVLMVIVCCVCCRGYQIISRRNRASGGGRQERGDREEEEPDSQSLGFDPACEYAFEPPRYETLPKDPPKYSEVFTTTTTIMEHTNAAFVLDEQAVAPLATTTTTTTTTPSTTTAAVAEHELPGFLPSDVQNPVLCSNSSTSGDVEVDDGRCQAEVVVVTVEDNGSEPGQSPSSSPPSPSS